ncbi:MAG: pyridoxamine 5'-phosphate oxidase family protein [Proteobacteria bacterium]|nr:pyridoxamine 5'-phosphate oxidase family protein [Pseudomonadota bacterium]
MKELSDLKQLFASETLAVLATHSGDQPHCCLVAFAFSDDLKHLLFATSRKTRKYTDICSNPRVAMLIDNRSNRESDFKQAAAVTAKGNAKEQDVKKENIWTTLYIEKHPHLSAFINSPDVALIKIDIEEYLIAGFDSTNFIKM